MKSRLQKILVGKSNDTRGRRLIEQLERLNGEPIERIIKRLYRSGLTYPQIAKRLGFSDATVVCRIMRSRGYRVEQRWKTTYQGRIVRMKP